ncbi:zinc ribbon domain-containing protein [Chloroflexota bacterium]
MASPYVLSGILFCSCGHALTGHSAKSGRNFYYQCSIGALSRAVKPITQICYLKKSLSNRLSII